ncbi:hypothetical protein F5B21DRAFT_496236 [Xylaria acuta]|nr:hypothetical protein F5B21DRAFT_496236 [Xylaria acuta]
MQHHIPRLRLRHRHPDARLQEDQLIEPDWHRGVTYSHRSIACAPVALPLKPHGKTAVT